MRITLPQAFCEQMQRQLGPEYDAFIQSLDEPALHGLRVNQLKLSRDAFLELTGLSLTKVPWNDYGLYCDDTGDYSKSPLYHAGLYYLQEPSAMRPAQLLPVSPGDRVLDLCAAPGGKSTQLGAALSGKGLLVSNDVSASRAKALLKNIEYFGITNSLILSEQPDRLAAHFPGYFDKILVDAPCSGEGMFRKKPSMTQHWDAYGPAYFGAIQREILPLAAGMLRPGGFLVYSTCTFSAYEDEESVAALLKACPDMQLVRQERLWPHRVQGEGHFCALLQKKDTGAVFKAASAFPRTSPGTLPDPLNTFLSEAGLNPDLLRGTIIRNRDSLYLIPDAMPDISGLRTVRTGWYLGEIKGKRFEPSGAFARAISPAQCTHTVDFHHTDPILNRYLKGETLVMDKARGWYLICTDGYPLGFAKSDGQGTLKNKYPAGWRWVGR